MKGQQRVLEGVVVRDKMDKTVIVIVQRRAHDTRFQKFLIHKKKYKVHDEKNECKVGDRVELISCRPISRQKSWRVRRVIEKAPLADEVTA